MACDTKIYDMTLESWFKLNETNCEVILSAFKAPGTAPEIAFAYPHKTFRKIKYSGGRKTFFSNVVSFDEKSVEAALERRKRFKDDSQIESWGIILTEKTGPKTGRIVLTLTAS
jgi:hypothetical protein